MLGRELSDILSSYFVILGKERITKTADCGVLSLPGGMVI